MGGGTGQETGAGGQAPTPTVEAAATVGCPVQSRETREIRERIKRCGFVKTVKGVSHTKMCYLQLRRGADLTHRKHRSERKNFVIVQCREKKGKMCAFMQGGNCES